MEDVKFTRRAEVATGIYAYIFNGNGRSTAVLSRTPQAGEYAIPDAEGVAALDLFGNPLPPGSTFSGTLIYLSTEEGVEFIEKLLGIAPAGTGQRRLNWR